MTSAARPNPMIPMAREGLKPLFAAWDRVIVGQRRLLERMLIALFGSGHLLLEGMPGLAKTLAVRTMAAALALDFSRIQFTPDLLPADLIGTQVYHPGTGQFTVKHGPIFANLILADEINRAPAKVQSALLEAMEERQVTIGDNSLKLPQPFMVLATQNPIDHEGTYPLPEAQIDRFMMKVLVDYPSREEELQVLDRVGGVHVNLTTESVLKREDLETLRDAVDGIHADAALQGYIVDIVRATRAPQEFRLGNLHTMIESGASPRGGIALLRCAKGSAFLAGRHYATPDDVKTVAADVLRHRVRLTYEAEMANLTTDELIRQILDGIPVP